MSSYTVQNITKCGILVVFLTCTLFTIQTNGIELRIPFLSFLSRQPPPAPNNQKPIQHDRPHQPQDNPPQQQHHRHPHAHQKPNQPQQEYHFHHQQQQPESPPPLPPQQNLGNFYLNADSTVNFYYKENLLGLPKQIDLFHDDCREIPMDYWHQHPKSLWAKHCIMLYENGNCKGNGVQVAGMVHELRSVGIHYGVTSFKPCEKNIKIKFMPPANHINHHRRHSLEKMYLPILKRSSVI